MTEQLPIPYPDPEPALRFVAVCPFCGDVLGLVGEVMDAGDRWYEATLWGYLAQSEHNVKVHGRPKLY